MRTFAPITIAFLAIVLFSRAVHTADYRTMVSQIHNDHVRWDGNYFGLEPALGESERGVLAKGLRCRRYLIEALEDNSRFVAAHVLLTMMECDSYSLSAAEWNHLQVTLYAGGHVEIPIDQRPAIQKLWTQK